MHFSSIALTGLLIAVAHGCYDDSHLFRRSENGSTEAAYTYWGEKGPASWGQIESNKLCATGKMQTPINLDASIKTESGSEYEMKIPDGNVKFLNKGHTVEVNHVENGTLTFGGNTYNLAQFHFHAPSEHLIDGKHSSLEVHFVHKTENGSIAVVGFLVEVGARSNPFLSKVLRQVKAIEKEGSETAIRGLQFGIIAKSLARNTVYRYQGSLTTPPCTEGLEWIVSSERLVVDWQLFNEIKDVMGFNSRFPQSGPGHENPLARTIASSGAR